MGRHCDKKVKNLKVCEDLTVRGQIRNVHKSVRLTKCDVASRAKNGTINDQYDMIIVGTGPGGATISYNMAKRYPNAKILILETGKDDVQDDAVIRTPADGPNPNNAPHDDWGQSIRTTFISVLGEGAQTWQQNITTLTGDQLSTYERKIAYSRGATLGGTTAINGCVWNRGSKQGTYDQWATILGEDPDDPQADFGWTKMVESFKRLENRSQNTRIYGSPPIQYWNNPAIPAAPPGYNFDPTLEGDNGPMFVTQALLPGYAVRAMNEVVATETLPGRSGPLQIGLNAENPNNPSEYGAEAPTNFYDQSDPSFASINPYPVGTPGSTYIPPGDPGNAKDSRYGGNPQAIGLGIPAKKNLHVRCFTANALMYPIIYKTDRGNPFPNNATVKTKAYVTRLLFTNPKDALECTGVEYVENGWHVANVNRAIQRDVKPWNMPVPATQAGGLPATSSLVSRETCSLEQAVENQKNATYKQAFAKTDIWICAGTLDSAAILQRSGIGRREDLESLKFSPVSCRLDLPGVGYNVKDTVWTSVAFLQEEDDNTYLPAGAGPASIAGLFWNNVFGFADTAENDTSSISGAPVQGGIGGGRLRLKSSPSISKWDTDILPFEATSVSPVGNFLWQDFINLLYLNFSTSSEKFDYTFDRSSIGDYIGNGQGISSLAKFYLSEYWNNQSSGEVKITSGNVFDRPNYAPNLMSNSNDIEAITNNMENNMIPICSNMAKKRYGPRGLFSYAFALGLGGFVQTTTQVQLFSNVTTTYFKPFASNEVIDQTQYDVVDSIVGATLTINNQSVKVTAWSGNTGNPLTSYVATVSPALSAAPAPGDLYAMSLATEFPYESVAFDDDNHRNFVRFIFPNGDQMFSDLQTTKLAVDPLTITANSTRVSVNAPAHGLTDGEMIKLSGIEGPVNGIPLVYTTTLGDKIDLFNTYHVIDNVTPNTFDIVLFWNKTKVPAYFDGPDPVPSPAKDAVAGSAGGSNVILHIIKFDRQKFSSWVQEYYSSGYHASGSCVMGLPDNETAVVDTRARVYNIKGLRVCDCSILPVKPDGNLVAPCMGIAQRIFELVSTEEYDHLL